MNVAIKDVRAQLGIRVGWLLGRYLDDFDLLDAVVSDVLRRWVSQGAGAGGATVEQVWEDYVDSVESAVGGAMCATDDDLCRVWLARARSVLPDDGTLTVQAPVASYDRWAGPDAAARSLARSGSSARSGSPARSTHDRLPSFIYPPSRLAQAG